MFGDLVALVLGYFGHRLAFGKILPNGQWERVEELLKEEWSPEQVSGERTR